MVMSDRRLSLRLGWCARAPRAGAKRQARGGRNRAAGCRQRLDGEVGDHDGDDDQRGGGESGPGGQQEDDDGC
jgi:hypothetical protein